MLQEHFILDESKHRGLMQQGQHTENIKQSVKDGILSLYLHKSSEKKYRYTYLEMRIIIHVYGNQTNIGKKTTSSPNNMVFF